MRDCYKECYINLTGSLGDIVACEPVTRYLHNTYPEIQINWIVNSKYKDILINNPYLHSVICVNSIIEADKICREKEKSNALIIDMHMNGMTESSGYIHINKNDKTGFNSKNIFKNYSILESFSQIAGLPPLDDNPFFYLKNNLQLSENLPKHYIIFHCKSANEMKDWTKEKWNKLAKKLLTLNFNIVEIGLSPIIKISKSPPPHINVMQNIII